MSVGDIAAVSTGECRDIYAVDVGMYDLPSHASVYVLDTPDPTIVETGTGANVERIVDALTELGIATEAVEHIVLTHVHLDHAGGAGFLSRVCPNADIYVHERGAPHLQDPSFLIEGTTQLVGEEGWERYYADPDPIDADRIRSITDGDVIDLGDRALRVHHAPGHAAHQVLFHSPSDDAVFTADALGIYVSETETVRAISPPSEFDAEQALADVETIRDIDPSTLLFSHFGATPTGDRLDQAATAIVEWVQDVYEARAEADADGAVVARFVDAVEGPDRWSEIVAETDTTMNVHGVLQYLDRQDGELPAGIARRE
jgi:glyoxylase-like metal-dependent hydrolase (beta-lactamase superfamily II)